MMILIGMFHGAMLFAGLALAFNTLAFTTTNWGFVLLLTFIGAMLGLLVGVLLRNAEPANAWALPLGSVAVAMMVGILAMAFDFFIFGASDMHWRGTVSLSLISSAPGLIVGWIIAQQFAGDRLVDASGQAARSPGVRLPPVRISREPLPPVQCASDFHAIRKQQLARILADEIGQFPSAVQVSSPEEVRGTGGNMCVTATLAGRGQMLKLYLICLPDYPDAPPQLVVERIDQLQGTSSEVQYRSQVVQHWGRNNRLHEVVEEVSRDFVGR